MRPIRYRIIADDLRDRITDGEFHLGSVLPSEADLSANYEASRVTVRRALEALRVDGMVESRQGFGWLVSADPVRQDLTRLATLDGQLGAAGVRSERRIVTFGFRRTPAQVKAFLSGRSVLEVVRLHLADDRPFARVTVWCREDIGATLSRDDVERSAFLEQLPVQLGGATQTIGADAASSSDAELLDIPSGSPVLVAERVTRDAAGDVVLVSEHVFPAHLTRFVVELPADDGLVEPTGLRIVEKA
ncbi:MAG TPA: GntR family transcriptional regulator [Microthrixaceae bacterium]|nr:GntR family transcriptional regulator [Microthrixaceae bacterium]